MMRTNFNMARFSRATAVPVPGNGIPSSYAKPPGASTLPPGSLAAALSALITNKPTTPSYPPVNNQDPVSTSYPPVGYQTPDSLPDNIQTQLQVLTAQQEALDAAMKLKTQQKFIG